MFNNVALVKLNRRRVRAPATDAAELITYLRVHIMVQKRIQGVLHPVAIQSSPCM